MLYRLDQCHSCWWRLLLKSCWCCCYDVKVSAQENFGHRLLTANTLVTAFWQICNQNWLAICLNQFVNNLFGKFFSTKALNPWVLFAYGNVFIFFRSKGVDLKVQIHSNDVIILLVIKFKSDRDLAYCHSLLMMIMFKYFVRKLGVNLCEAKERNLQLPKLTSTSSKRPLMPDWPSINGYTVQATSCRG